MRNRLILSVAAALAASPATPLASGALAQPAHLWEIGPIIGGRNRSIGLPLRPTAAGRGWSFEFPYPHAGAGHVHYVTFDPGPLAGASRIVVRYRVEAPRGVRFVPQERPQEPATVSIILQRAGDNWRGRGPYEYYRWFAPPATVRPIAAGEYEMTVSLRDGRWISVLGREASSNPAAFEEALRETQRVGLVFGSSSLRGHGVYATGPARFRLISFRVT